MSDLRGSVLLPGLKFYPAVMVLLSFSRIASGQSTFASITGTVTDSSGAAVPGAKIIVKNDATNIEATANSNESGIYTVAELNEGVYSLRSQAAGFKEFVAADVALAARDVRRIDVVLQVGSMDTKVEVTVGATLIETETARISDIKTVGTIDQLPLNSMSIWASLALSPNLLQAGNGSSTLRFAGSTANQANWSIDGTSFSDGVTATQIGPLANFVEWMQELKIDLANNSAEFGTLGQVTAISKAGTNDFHGAAFDYYTTPGFLARNPFALTRPSGVSQYPGIAGWTNPRAEDLQRKEQDVLFRPVRDLPWRGSPATTEPDCPSAGLAQRRFLRFAARDTDLRSHHNSAVPEQPDSCRSYQSGFSEIPESLLSTTELRERFHPAKSKLSCQPELALRQLRLGHSHRSPFFRS